MHLHHSPKHDSLSKNGLWDFNSTYGGYTWAVTLTPPPLPQGLGQGNGAAPTIWDIVSTPLSNCLIKSVHGAAFKCCISGNTTKLVGRCFVNDSTIVQIAPSTNTPTEDTVNLDQQGLNIFAGSERATGEQVTVQKTKWYLLDFTGYPAGKLHSENNNDRLSLKTQEGYQPIKRLPPSRSSRIFRVWISPDVTSHDKTRRP